jgi:lipoprotein-releasing system permease protein
LPFEFFIARRILRNEVQGKKVSRPIVRISVISIALAVVVNLITIAVVTGFQNQVREKVSGFGSHIFIMSAGENSIYESEPLLKNQTFIDELKSDSDIASVHSVGYKSVILQSDKFEQSTNIKGKDTVIVAQEIHGGILKGVYDEYDWSFFQRNLVSGRIPNFSKDKSEVLVSKKVADQLNLKVGDDVKAFFVKNNPIKRVLKLSGIYSSGLEEFDSKFIVGDISIVQELNDWGIMAEIEVADTMTNGQLIIKGAVNGGNGNYRYDWGKGYENYSGFTLCPTKDTTIRLIASDFWSNISGRNEQTSIPDTAYLELKIKGTGYSFCDFKLNQDKELIKKYLNEDGSKFSISASEKLIIVTSKKGKGSFYNYIGGYEINVKDWNRLREIHAKLKKKHEFIPTKNNETLAVTSIIDNENDIFVWLGFLDLNVVIILTLMILIGIINMGSALLVLILVRSNFIGLMKGMGATNWQIRKVFLYQAAFLILRGMIIGNLVGVGLCYLQASFGIVSLNPEVYYLDKVPVELNLLAWGILNVSTLLICVLSLIIPSYAITRISPSKAIKFN